MNAGRLLAAGLGHFGGEPGLLQFADVPLLEAQCGANRTLRPEEGDLVVFQATAAGHVGVPTGKLSHNAIDVLDLPRHETIFSFSVGM